MSTGDAPHIQIDTLSSRPPHPRVSVLCRSCGYDLRGLIATSTCPECGRPVGESLDAPLLRHADPAWLRSIDRGIRHVNTAVNWGLALLFVAPLLIDWAGRFAGKLPGNLDVGITVLLFIIPSALAASGFWRLSEPGEGAYSQRGWSRAVLRILGPVVLPLWLWCGFFAGAIAAWPAVAVQINRATAQLIALVVLWAMLARLTFLAGLASPDDPEIRKRSTTIRRDVLFLSLMVVVIGWGIPLLARGAPYTGAGMGWMLLIIVNHWWGGKKTLRKPISEQISLALSPRPDPLSRPTNPALPDQPA